jgi:hypothetical protein
MKWIVAAVVAAAALGILAGGGLYDTRITKDEWRFVEGDRKPNHATAGGPAHAWDWYSDAASVRCDSIGTLPEMAVAVGNGLPIASAKPILMLAWFAKHPQYAEEISREREFIETHCRED